MTQASDVSLALALLERAGAELKKSRDLLFPDKENKNVIAWGDFRRFVEPLEEARLRLTLGRLEETYPTAQSLYFVVTDLIERYAKHSDGVSASLTRAQDEVGTLMDYIAAAIRASLSADETGTASGGPRGGLVD